MGIVINYNGRILLFKANFMALMKTVYRIFNVVVKLAFINVAQCLLRCMHRLTVLLNLNYFRYITPEILDFLPFAANLKPTSNVITQKYKIRDNLGTK